MHIDFSCTNQVLTWNIRSQINIYTNVQKIAQKTEWMRLGGVGVAVVSGSVALIKSIGLIVESALKGLSNVFGSLYSNHFNAKKGFKQLFFNTLVALASLPIVMIIVTVNLIVTPFWMLFDPKGCTNFFLQTNLNSKMHMQLFWS